MSLAARALVAVSVAVLVGTGLACSGRLTSSAAAAEPTDPTCALVTTYRAPADGEPTEPEWDDVTARWGAEVPLAGMMAHAMASADVDGDGWVDLFVGTFADRPAGDYRVRGATGPSPDRLLLGGPSGFTPAPDFPEMTGRTSGAAFADLNGDGRPDLVLARNVRDWPRGSLPSQVLENLGGGRFEVKTDLPLPVGARSIGLLDYDGDGRTDLFITEDRWTDRSSRLLHNDGDLAFSDATSEAELPDHLVGMGVSTADLDGDGRPDLFVAGANRLFHNEGDGTFREAGDSDFTWVEYGDEDDPAGVAAGDLNADGLIDLVVGQHYGSTLDQDRRVPVRAYLNETPSGGPLRFRDITESAGLVGIPTKAPHVELADVDADGRVDILTTASTKAGGPLVFRNLGGADPPRFAAMGEAGPAQYWPAGTVADFDHDGRLDVALAEFDVTKSSLLLRNGAPTGHWIGLDLPVGSRVTGTVTGPEGARALPAIVTNASTGFGSASAPIAWIGLANGRAVRLQVEEPGRDATPRRYTVSTTKLDRVARPRCLRG